MIPDVVQSNAFGAEQSEKELSAEGQVLPSPQH